MPRRSSLALAALLAAPIAGLIVGLPLATLPFYGDSRGFWAPYTLGAAPFYVALLAAPGYAAAVFGDREALRAVRTRRWWVRLSLGSGLACALAAVIVGLPLWPLFLPPGLVSAANCVILFVEFERGGVARGEPFPWSRGLVLGTLSVVGVLLLGWAFMESSKPVDRKLHDRVDAWPLYLRVEPPVPITRNSTNVCLLLPRGFHLGLEGPAGPPVVTPNGMTASAKTEVCFKDGGCLVLEGWGFKYRGDEEFYCPGWNVLPMGRTIVAVRIEGSEALEADSVWLTSYDAK